MPPFVKVIVGDAVRRSKGLITEWPTSFPSIAEAEEYVSDILEWQRFRYGHDLDAPRHVVREVRTRTQHGIAIEAHKDGRFKLERMLTTGRDLWFAVDEGIEMAQGAVGQYPKSFSHINAARAYVQKICQEQGLKFKSVNRVAPDQLAIYVYYNTARRAYEVGKFSLDKKPDTPFKGEWKAPCPASKARVSKARPSPPKAYTGYVRPSPAVTTTSRIDSGATKHSNVKKSPKNAQVAPRMSSTSHNRLVETTSNRSTDIFSKDSAGTSSNSSTKASSNDQSDIMLVDLGTPSTSTLDTTANLGDFPLIDLSTATVGTNTLIDLGQPELTVTEDFAALIGIFSADATMFKDEGLNELLHCENLIW